MSYHQNLSQNSDNTFIDANEAALLRERFLRWQCRLRQIVMREHKGRPDQSIMAEMFFPDQEISAGQIITLILKSENYSQTPEFKHISLKTYDPAKRLEEAVKFLSAGYYQNAHQFSDDLLASFTNVSSLAEALCQKKQCLLKFQAYQQSFILLCDVKRLEPQDYFFQAGWWHNSLFNPNLSKEIFFLSFKPNWGESKEI